jgi:hypothetical protein
MPLSLLLLTAVAGQEDTGLLKVSDYHGVYLNKGTGRYRAYSYERQSNGSKKQVSGAVRQGHAHCHHQHIPKALGLAVNHKSTMLHMWHVDEFLSHL